MKNESVIRCTVAASLFLFAASVAGPVAANGKPDRDVAVAQLMSTWQQRILAARLPVEDPSNWARRNLAKFSRLNAEQIDLAQKAQTLGELELLTMSPPLPEGSRLGLVMASQPSDISMMGAGHRAKSSPATAPAAYADLVFTAVTPCRMLDSRASQGGTGPWTAGSTNSIKIGPYAGAGGGYATGTGAQGGSASGCGLDNLAGPGKIAVVMVAVSTVAQAGAGYLTFFSAGAPNPGATSVSQWYQPGYVQTSFVLIPTDLISAVTASGFSSATTEVIIDVTGYFAAPGNINLANSTATTGNILKGGNPFIHNFGAFNTFIGVNAGNFTMSGPNNTASGTEALSSNTAGFQNTASGYQALFSNTTGDSNTASGSGALYFNTTGFRNTASGQGALYSNTTSQSNTANGAGALFFNTTGNSNTASGAGALQNNATGAANTASGTGALYNNTIGVSNTAIGGSSLFNNTTGGNNIGIGNGAGFSLTTGSNNINIGNIGGAGEIGTIRIGTPGTNLNAFIAGIRGVTTGVANAIPVLVDSNGQLGTVSSSRRFKDDIADMDASTSALMKLRPVTFHYKSDQAASGRTLQYGLVAEEVAQVYPGLIAHSADGEIETVMYQFLPPMLLNEFQKQQRIIAELRQEQQSLRKAMLDMSQAVDGLRRANSVTASLPGR